MKGEHLGEFEELLLLAIRALGDSYGVPIQQLLERTTGRAVSMGAVYAALDRLEDKGLVESAMGEPTAKRGGKRKRLFTVTRLGLKAVQDARQIRERMWRLTENRR